jgi:nitroimidazol reductase NimA-like FMN-containing flavoprotein (pyridoxamine 5'-phosphate oxidase superfamily)
MKTLFIANSDEVKEIIRESVICYLGVSDKNGTPSVYPMNFGYKDGVIYLHSAPEGHLIDIINQNNQVCITFCTDTKLVFQHPQVACSYRMKSKSVLAWGKVEFVDEFEEKENILHILMSQYSDDEFKFSTPAVRNVKIWKIVVEKMTCKAFAEPHQK